MSTTKIKINEYNNLEHFPTGLVFNKLTNKVIGKQNVGKGNITPLTNEDIKNCMKFNFTAEDPGEEQ
jgi:hypothetical protein